LPIGTCNAYLGDPAFVDNPIARLLSAGHAAAIRTLIQPHRATPSSTLGESEPDREKATTTHFSIVDCWGNAVAMTTPINDDFGAKVIAGDTGFFLNDEMDDFTAKPGTANLFGLGAGKANAIAPGKRPLSSMTPTLVLKGRRTGAGRRHSGGARIITTVLEIIVNVIDQGMTLQVSRRCTQAASPNGCRTTLAAEPFALSDDTSEALTRMGYRVVPSNLGHRQRR